MNPLIVYVRLGADRNESTRVVSFTIPEGVSQKEILDHGYAIDGDDAAASVEEQGVGDPENYRSVYDCLHATQQILVTWMEKLGYEVTFK